MIEVKRIGVEPGERDYIQFLHFEKNSFKEILGFILLEKHKGYEYSKENYEHFMNEFREANIKYQLTFGDLIYKYAAEYYGNTRYEAEFDFEACEMIIFDKGDK